MVSGGPREGRQGALYSNRSDLNANPTKTTPAAPPSASQVPLTPNQQPPARAGESGGLFRDTENPTEPVQAGLPIGPGAGQAQGLDDIGVLRAIYQRFPNDGLRQLIERADQGGY